MFKNAFAPRPTPKALLSLKTGNRSPFLTIRPLHSSDVKLLALGKFVKSRARRVRVCSATRPWSSPADGPLVDPVLGGEELPQLELAFF